MLLPPTPRWSRDDALTLGREHKRASHRALERGLENDALLTVSVRPDTILQSLPFVGQKASHTVEPRTRPLAIGHINSDTEPVCGGDGASDGAAQSASPELFDGRPRRPARRSWWSR